ncbi:MAG: DUF2169 domain-containing protein [Methylovirgula sp.]
MVRVIKPQTLGILLRTQRRGNNTHYIVSALGLFDVASPEMFLAEQALWPAVMKELPEGAVFDQGLPKPQGELLVAGHAKAPSGSPTRAMMLEIVLGTIGKRVAVFGDRYWRPGAGGFVFTEPQPFSEMQIDLRRMYGGAEHPQNTLGTGYQSVRLLDAQQLAPLPNFEDPRRLIRTIEETPPPVGLGPIDLMSRDKTKYAGTFDKLWQETIAPHPPIDTDPRVYCAAPEDQRIAGFFNGDETLRVNGMTADEPGYAGRLPSLRARAFVMRTSAPAGFLELDMKLDTVLLLGSHRKGVVIFRGAVPVADIDAKDVDTVMLAYERMRDAPRPIDHYAEVYRLRTGKDTAIKYVFAESQLAPERTEAEKAARLKAREEHTRAIAERFAEGAHLMARRQIALAGLPASLVPAKPEPVPFPVLLPTPEELESGDVDLAELLDGMEKMGTEARERLEGIRDMAEAARNADGSVDLTKLLTDLDGAAGLETGAARKSLDDAKTHASALDAILAGLDGTSDEAKDRLTQSTALLTGLIQEGRLLPQPAVVDETAYKEACGRFLEMPDLGLLGKARAGLIEAEKTLTALTPEGMPASDSASEPFSDLVASLAEQTKAQPDTSAASRLGAIDQQLRDKFPALAGRSEQSFEALLNDLSAMAPAAPIRSPADASASLAEVGQKLDEAEAPLKEGIALLRKLAVEPMYPDPPLGPATALRFGIFVYDQWRHGADLRGRDLAGADLSGMDFSGADFSGAFLERANLSRANLTGANCESAVFAGAKLDTACFDGANLKSANLSRASAKAASFRRTNLENIHAMEAGFAGSDFESARFAETQFIKMDLSNARWVGVIAKKIVFVQSCLDGFQAAGASFERCQFIDCDAAGFNLRNGAMIRCAVLKFRAAQADFSGSTLDGTGFAADAEMPGARFDGASLRGVTLQGANLAGSSFLRARLDGAVVSESQIADSDFTCASLKRAQFSAADLSRCDFFAANLFEAQLRRANLSGARLRSANLYSTNFADSDLTGADLTAANRNKSQLALETSHGA